LELDDPIIETPGGYADSGLYRFSYDVINLLEENEPITTRIWNCTERLEIYGVFLLYTRCTHMSTRVY
jgi:hypothetical protein